MKSIQVEISKQAQKQIDKAPIEIGIVVLKWVESVEKIGIEETRKIGGKGLHDEPLKGELRGLRSIRLNKSWRLYYQEIKGEFILINIVRVDKHKY